MPKRLLYAVLGLPLHSAVGVLSAIAVAVAGPAAAQPESPPCAACAVVVLEPGQAVLLPAELHGLEVLVRTASGGPAAGPDHPEVGAIRAAGGRPGLLFDLSAASGDPDALAFELKTRLTAARGSAPDLRLALAAAPDLLSALLARDIAPYVDAIVDLQREPLRDVAGALSGADGGRPRAWRLPADAIDARRVLADLARAARWLVPALVPSGTANVRCGGRAARTYLDPRALDTIAILEGCAADAELSVSPPSAGVERIALSNGWLLVRVPAAEGRFAEEVGVGGTRTLTVEEIIARHQAATARRVALVRTLISRGTMTLTFEAPGFPAPIAITSEAIIYADPSRSEIEQRGIRINGIEFQGGGVPRLPIIEPERVASPPLTITLTDVYRYALEGRDRIGNTTCYVVSFGPVDRSRPSFQGRAWIATDSFAMVKVAAAQTGLRGPIVSSEQVDEFRPEREGVWLLARSEVRQIYEGAAHRTPIHRVLAIASHDINPPAFAAQRAAAYASSSVMLRDTPEGYRYLRRDRGDGSGAAPGEPAIAGRADRVRTVALGVIVDPNISHPLPFAGLSYVDFNLFGTGTQLNAFFGGTYGQLAFSAPSLGGSRWQLAGRAFGIASSYNDRAFVGGREIYERNIRQRPAHASVWLLRPVTPRITLRAGYELDYTHFGRSDLTAEAFTVPAHQVAHAARLAVDGQRAGWNATIWWAPARRSGWGPWGFPPGTAGGESDYSPRHRDYQRYGVTLTRPLVLTPRLVGRIEGAWMGGTDLDRFSRFSFGTFDNRLRGYPSALIRYDRGGVLRLAAAWGAARLLRIDGFFDTAWVHDPGFGAGLQNYTGAGGAIEAPAPFGTLVALEWGYGFQGVNSNGRRGTQVVRVTGYKMF